MYNIYYTMILCTTIFLSTKGSKTWYLFNYLSFKCIYVIFYLEIKMIKCHGAFRSWKCISVSYYNLSVLESLYYYNRRYSLNVTFAPKNNTSNILVFSFKQNVENVSTTTQGPFKYVYLFKYTNKSTTQLHFVENHVAYMRTFNWVPAIVISHIIY